MATATAGGRRRAAHRRALVWGLVAILLGALVAPLGGYLYVAVAYAENQQTDVPWKQNPRADTWRQVRAGDAGITQASGPYTTNRFIQNGGENWRNLRNGPVAGIMPWVMALMLLVLGAFHVLHGPNRLQERPSGRRVERWSVPERVLHWFTAISFIVMAITGLSLLFGRAVLIPVLGFDGFSAWALFSKGLHNYLGPFFTVGVLLMILAWIRDNIPNRVDAEWFRKAGGMAGTHASAGRFNGGEKVWFWFIATFGLAVCITGLIMDFPNFGQSRETMQVANLLHSVIAIVWIAVAFGHIYIGTAGTEGALEGMTSGSVSEEWAREHHDLWLEQVRAARRAAAGDNPPGPAAGPAHGPAARHD